MKQKLAGPQRLVVGVAAMAVGTDVDVEQVQLAVVDPREAVTEIDPAFPDRFDLGAEQHQPRLEGLEEMVVVERLSVFRDVGLRQLSFGLVFHHLFTGGGAPPPPRTYADASPRIRLS